MSVTFTDLFCGAGGSSTGLVEAGFELVLAANHWDRAIETHARNHPHAEHLCADINNLDMRRLPHTDGLWASPICTENSPGGGNTGRRSRRADGQQPIEAFGHVPQAGFERTRATFHDVIRATEVHRYKFVLVENVPDVAWRWELFDWWILGMQRLGYRARIICASSAHLTGHGNDPAAQWRDRLYLAFTRQDLPEPDLDVRPRAWCEPCGTNIDAVQTWKPKTLRILGQPVGKYRAQYTYTCPRGHATVEPYVLPAASVIDWTDTGRRIGDRKHPLAAATQHRIAQGLAMLREAAPITVNHDGHDGRPLPLATYPLLEPCDSSRHRDTADATHPFRPRPTPPAFIATLRNHGGAEPIAHPLTTVSAQGNHHALVIPYRRANKPTTTREPLHTLATHDSAALVAPDLTIEDCHFRMLKPREQLSAQRFPRDYQITGNIGEQTMQAGNAVPVNAAHWLAHRYAAVL